MLRKATNSKMCMKSSVNALLYAVYQGFFSSPELKARELF